MFSGQRSAGSWIRTGLAAAVAMGLAACGSSTSVGDAGTAGGASGGVVPTPVPGDVAGAQTIYSFANGCYALRSDAGYVTADSGAHDYMVTDNAAEATAFYMKPTALGSYLLLSAYSRAPGEPGNKALLGISDPAGELLDEVGNFIGEVGYLVGGIGDMADFFLDPLAPGLGGIRDTGEGLGEVGGVVGGIDVAPSLAMVDEASDLAVWNLLNASGNRFTLTSAVTGLRLAAAEGALGLTKATAATGLSTEFELIAQPACDAYPEVSTNAEIVDPRGPAKFLLDVPLFAQGPGAAKLDRNDVYGYVDGHAHLTAYEFIGGRVNYGDPFHKFGVDHALDDCAVNHGPQGVLGVVETVTSGFNPVHETKGWPSFNFWPRHNSLQHHQTYYKWVERAYLSGLRVFVNHFTGNDLLCQLNPQKENACDFEQNWRLQAQRAHEMQDYIDAQYGGPGKGWFRIVTSPAEARAVIADGKLAVVFGIEISKLFNCGEFLGLAECTREELIQRMDAAYAAGVRHLFPIHKFDNAFGGVVPDEGFGIGTVLYVGNLAETGHPLEFEACPETYGGDSAASPDDVSPLGIVDQLLRQLEYVNGQASRSPLALPPLAPQSEHGLCNIRGLTDLGQFLVEETMRRRMIIEVDHSSLAAIDRIFEIAENNNYPGITSSHDWLYSEELLDRVVAGGGTIKRFGSSRGSWVDRLNRVEQRPSRNSVGDVATTGMASDVNGIASLPGNSGDPATPLYPFTSVDGRVRFEPQVTGDHTFNLYDGRGVSHYGLFADQIADMQRFTDDKSREEIDHALRQLFSSAEAYLRQWEAVEAWRQ
ncbi:MAG: hypothetical protein M3O62_18195 [Pseudomonadota bacterium]|nr:hypothetical protein [Pseudomonadota bacterium]